MPLSAPGKLITNFMKVNHLGLSCYSNALKISITFPSICKHQCCLLNDIIDCDSCDSVIIGEGHHDTPLDIRVSLTLALLLVFTKLDAKEI